MDSAGGPVSASGVTVREVHHPRRVLIVGGGTAGWITAVLLRNCCPASVDITLVESADIPTVGVGEATLPGIRTLLRYAGIAEAEFLAACDATFKTGIRFSGWNPARDYWHPFGAVSGPSVLIDDWLRAAATGPVPPVDDALGQGTWAPAAAQLAPQSAASAPYTGELPVYAYHLDAARLAVLLSEHGIRAGVRHVTDNVTSVSARPDGWLTSVRTAAHGDLAADLFIDCTGFRSLLLNGALGEPFESFRDQLWCDRAVAINVPGPARETPAAAGPGRLPPYTRASTGAAGWIWEIPLFSRTGNGYVYSSAFLEPDAAEAELRAFLRIDDSLPARHIPIRSGKSRRVWVGNCVAVGLSGGFIEPLESTGIGLIADVAEFFVHFSPDLAWTSTFAAKLNGFVDGSYDLIRDFVACHYVTAARDDTPFWREVRRDRGVRTTGIEEILSQWRRGELRGLAAPDGSRPAFTRYSWAYIIGGNGVLPGPEAAVRALDAAELASARAGLAGKAAAVRAASAVLPGHRDRIASLREAWQRGEQPPARPDRLAYSGHSHQLITGYLTDGREVPWVPSARG